MEVLETVTFSGGVVFGGEEDFEAVRVARLLDWVDFVPKFFWSLIGSPPVFCPEEKYLKFSALQLILGVLGSAIAITSVQLLGLKLTWLGTRISAVIKFIAVAEYPVFVIWN